MFYKSLCIVFFTLCCFVADARSPENILSSAVRSTLVSSGSYYIDSSCSLSFDKMNDVLFLPHAANAVLQQPLVKDGADCYWVRFELTNQADTNREWVLDFGSWEQVDLYAGDSAHGYERKITGAILPFAQRDFPIGGRNLVSLTIRQGESIRVYVKLTTGKDYMERPENLACTVYSKSALLHDEESKKNILYFFAGIYMVMFLYNIFVYFSIRERSYLYYLFLIVFALYALGQNTGYTVELLKGFARFPASRTNFDLVASSVFGAMLLLFTRVSLNTKQSSPIIDRVFNGVIIALILVLLPAFWGNSLLATNLSSLLGLLTTTLIIIASLRCFLKKYPSAGIFLLANGSFMISIFAYLLLLITGHGDNSYVGYLLPLGSALQIVLYSLALGDRINVLKKQNAESQQKIIEQLKMYSDLQSKINRELEDKVEERTRELKESQKQLLQQEKLASLGEVTAGVAHEIQNPLNFIKNFSEVNTELVVEAEEELNAGNIDEAKSIAGEIRNNSEKILTHVERIDSIVKGMLHHTRADAGQREEVDLNAICDEYLRLSYHGLRAKDKSFNTALVQELDPGLHGIKANRQNLGRVLLNLFNNAFYAVNEKQAAQRTGYQPTVKVTTARKEDSVEIRVWDNGTGIPRRVIDKIFQPFFTTKPTGKGTGLGLSISFEIIRDHGGQLKVNTEEGNFTEFVITLPAA